jgi:hypothetical protein
MFAIDVASSAAVYWQPLNDHRARVEVDLRGPKTIGIAALSEDIRQGQIVARYILEGERDDTWITLSEGTTIGYRKLDRFDPVRGAPRSPHDSRRSRDTQTRSDRPVRAGVAFARDDTPVSRSRDTSPMRSSFKNA